MRLAVCVHFVHFVLLAAYMSAANFGALAHLAVMYADNVRPVFNQYIRGEP